MASSAPTVTVLGDTEALSQLMTRRLVADSLPRFGILVSGSPALRAQKEMLSKLATALAPSLATMDIAKFPIAAVGLPEFAPTFGRGIAPDLTEMLASIQKGLIGPLNLPKIEAELLRFRPMVPHSATAADSSFAEQVLPAQVHEDAILPGSDVAEWLRALPLEKRRELAVRLGHATTATLLLANAMFDRQYLMIAAVLIGVATAYCALYWFVLNEIERHDLNDS